MFEKITKGEWVVIGLSILFAALSGANFGIVLISSLIGLSILYWIITRIYPKSKDWGVIVWILAIGIIPVVLLISAGIGAAFVTGLTSPNNPWATYSNFGISFNHPANMPVNTSALDYLNASYYKGELLFDNPEHQAIAVVWWAKGNTLSPDLLQKVFSSMTSSFKKYAPDLQTSTIQETTHSGKTIYFMTASGHDATLNGSMAYDVVGIWEDPQSQRDFLVATVSYRSKEDAQALFNGVLNSFVGH